MISAQHTRTAFNGTLVGAPPLGVFVLELCSTCGDSGSSLAGLAVLLLQTAGRLGRGHGRLLQVVELELELVSLRLLVLQQLNLCSQITVDLLAPSPPRSGAVLLVVPELVSYLVLLHVSLQYKSH